MKSTSLVIFLLLAVHKMLICQNYDIVSQYNNWPVYIDLNARHDDITGIPIKTAIHQIKIPSLSIDTLFSITGRDSSVLNIKRVIDTIHFTFSKPHISIEGNLFIPAQRLSKYVVRIDPETFASVVRIEEFYIPIRTGIWNYNINGKKYQKNQAIRYKHDQNQLDYYFYSKDSVEIFNPFIRYLKEKDDVYSVSYGFDFWGLFLEKTDVEEFEKLTYHSENLLAFLKNNTNYYLEIGVQTDCRGSESDNLKLSQKRAESIKKFLTKRGINKKRLKAKGLGEQQFVNCDCNCDCSDLKNVFLKCSEFDIETANRVTYKILEIK